LPSPVFAVICGHLPPTPSYVMACSILVPPLLPCRILVWDDRSISLTLLIEVWSPAPAFFFSQLVQTSFFFLFPFASILGDHQVLAQPQRLNWSRSTQSFIEFVLRLVSLLLYLNFRNPSPLTTLKEAFSTCSFVISSADPDRRASVLANSLLSPHHLFSHKRNIRLVVIRVFVWISAGVLSIVSCPAGFVWAFHVRW